MKHLAQRLFRPVLPAAWLFVALLPLGGCDLVGAILAPPLLPVARPHVDQMVVVPGRTQDVKVGICPPMRYTTDLGYIPMHDASVQVGTGPLPAGVRVDWQKSNFSPDDFGEPRLCIETIMQVTTSPDIDLSRDLSFDVQARSPQLRDEPYGVKLTLMGIPPAPAPVPPNPSPSPQACGAADTRTWQPLANGQLGAATDAALDDAQLVRAGTQLLAAWSERRALAVAVRVRQWTGSDWAAPSASQPNAVEEAEIDHLRLLGLDARPGWLETPEAWLVYAASDVPGVGQAHPMRLVARRMGRDGRFNLAVPAVSIGAPSVMAVGRSRDGLHVATVLHGETRLRLWHASADGPGAAWVERTLPVELADAIVRQVVMGLDAEGRQLMMLNRIDPIDGALVERVQVWRLAAPGDLQPMVLAARDQVLQSRSQLFYGATDLALLTATGRDGLPLIVTAWTAGDSAPGHHITVHSSSTGIWLPHGQWSVFAEANRLGSFSFNRQLLAGCNGAATLVWSDFGAYPARDVWVAGADNNAPAGWALLGAVPLQGDRARYSGLRGSVVWNGIDGAPLALILRSDPLGGLDDLVLRALQP